METTATQEPRKGKTRDVCPRCAGKGELEGFRHVKAGVCFNCWGSGVDFPGMTRKVDRAVAEERGRWVRMSRRLKRATPGSVEALSCEQALHDIETRGKALVRHAQNLKAERQSWADRHK